MTSRDRADPVTRSHARARPYSLSRVRVQESEIALKHDAAAHRESVWRPTQWKRVSMFGMMLISGLLLTCLFEFSFWTNFGTNIWYGWRIAALQIELLARPA